MDYQKTFDAVARHLHKQGRRAYDPENDRCLYRGPGGTKCAIGALIPDEAIDEAWLERNNYRSVLAVVSKLPDEHRARNQEAIDFLGDLQTAHDCGLGMVPTRPDSVVVEEWPEALRYYAGEWELDDAIVTELWGEEW